MPPKRVLLVFLNTGGGHRSAALAVSETLRRLYECQVCVELVDVTADCFPWPFSKLDAVYAGLVGLNGWPWALTYDLTNSPRRVAMLEGSWWFLTGRSIHRLLNNHPADVIVCCHPLLKAPITRALEEQEREIPLITLVTDLASGHAAWFHPPVGTCLVATEHTRERALSCGLPGDIVHVTGLPVRPRFVREAGKDPVVVRKKLGLEEHTPVLLLLSGADGMGPFYSLVNAIMNRSEDVQIVAITGRNKSLRAKLATGPWPRPLRVEGFVENIQEWMLAADLLVTKAGPSTITEALVMGTPMIISGAVPGQEPPNIAYATETGAAIWAERSDQAAEVVRELFSSHSEKLATMTRRAKEAGRPDAAQRVARLVWRHAWESTGPTE